MKEKLISLETAILAKENGFKIVTRHFYRKNKITERDSNYDHHINNGLIHTCINKELNLPEYDIKPIYNAPTVSLLHLWVIENFSITAVVYPTILGWTYSTMSLLGYTISDADKHFETYEIALEKGICKILKSYGHNS